MEFDVAEDGWSVTDCRDDFACFVEGLDEALGVFVDGQVEAGTWSTRGDKLVSDGTHQTDTLS